VEIRVLGPLEVDDHGRNVPLGGPGERKVLALLALQANRVVSTDRLIEELWGDEPPQTARNIVQRYVSNLRRSLEKHSERLETRSPGYLLKINEDELDAARFERMLADARNADDPRRAASGLGAALALWRGRPLDDIDPGPSLGTETARLNELRLNAVEARIEADLALGEDAVLVGELEGLVHLHPLRERFRGQLMLALYRAGRQSDALRAYQEARRTLGEELGIEPTNELQELEDRMLRQDPELLLPSSPRLTAPAPLPTGAVTFLFTDIEGSTARWEENARAMEAAQATSRRLIGAAVDLHHGVVFKVVGDGMYAAFESAPDALAAARDAQLALGEEDWAPAAALRIRMAAHTGTAFPSDGDYLGPPLNRCARLLDAGHGGQILVSATTFGLTTRGLPPGIELLGLGSFQLPGLPAPEEIYQLISSDLESEFPALRAPTAVRTNLPSSRSAFIGRTAALSEVQSALRQARLVTLVGAGGAGKTRLAFEVGAGMLDQYADGVWLVELASIVDPELVVAAAAEDLGVPRRPTQGLMESVLDHLRSRSLLMILDNCEHVIEGAASLADTALRGAPGLTLLATSREGLGVEGEQRWPIPPMVLPAAETPPDQLLGNEAVQLFADRATHARAGYSVDASNAATVAQICRDLDGMPLAIELGAARLKTLSLTDLAARLEDRFALLTGGARTSLPRHQTLRAVVDWSFELLDEDERLLFGALSIFAGGFTLQAAEAVAAPGLEVLDLLDRLVDKSLVIAEIADGGEARYHMLETLRRYAEETLVDRPAAGAVASRHASHFLQLAEEAQQKLRGPDPAWYGRLDLEHDNLRKAMGWALGSGEQPETAARLAVALREFWQVRGHWREAQRWLDLSLEKADHLPTGVRGKLDHAAGVISAMRRDYGRAFPHLEAALQAFGDTAEPGATADALFDLAQAVARHGDYPKAEGLLAEGRRLYGAQGNETGVAEANCVLAQVAVFRGDHQTAALSGREARDRFEQTGDQYGEAWVLSVLGELAYAHDDLDEAEKLFRSAATLADEIDIPQFVANGLQGLGDVEVARGHFRDAERLLAESLRINEEIGDTLFVAGVLASLAELAATRGDHLRAARLWGHDQQLREDLGSLPPRRRGGRYDRVSKELRHITRENLGQAGFTQSTSEGAALDLAAVVEPGD
jgi:predicted ATPase/DNA-binding SARP family transcriptional activator